MLGWSFRFQKRESELVTERSEPYDFTLVLISLEQSFMDQSLNTLREPFSEMIGKDEPYRASLLCKVF